MVFHLHNATALTCSGGTALTTVAFRAAVTVRDVPDEPETYMAEDIIGKAQRSPMAVPYSAARTASTVAGLPHRGWWRITITLEVLHWCVKWLCGKDES